MNKRLALVLLLPICFGCSLIPPDCDIYNGQQGELRYIVDPSCSGVIADHSRFGNVKYQVPTVGTPEDFTPKDFYDISLQFSAIAPSANLRVLPEWNERQCFEERNESRTPGGEAEFVGFYLELDGAEPNARIGCCTCHGGRCQCNGSERLQVEVCGQSFPEDKTCVYCVSSQDHTHFCAMQWSYEDTRPL